jgi:hypothetical protein
MTLTRAQFDALYPRTRFTDAQIEARALAEIGWRRHPSVSSLARYLNIGLPRMRRIIDQSDRLYLRDGASLLRLGYGPYSTGLINHHGQDTYTITEYSRYVYAWEAR